MSLWWKLGLALALFLSVTRCSKIPVIVKGADSSSDERSLRQGDLEPSINYNNPSVSYATDTYEKAKVLPEPQGPIRAALISVSVALSQTPQPKLQVRGHRASV